jgi:hypothetical protein
MVLEELTGKISKYLIYVDIISNVKYSNALFPQIIWPKPEKVKA